MTNVTGKIWLKMREFPTFGQKMELDVAVFFWTPEVRESSVGFLPLPRKLMSSEMYSGPARSLWELLQNADDCSYSEAPEIQIHRMGPSDLWMLG